MGAFQTELPLQNIYNMPEFEAQRPVFTTKTDDFQGWIDHIWVTSMERGSRAGGSLKVSHVLVPPLRAGDVSVSLKAREFAPIPSPHFPSDHLPIGLIASIASD